MLQSPEIWLPLAQGGYYAVTGLWPLVSRSSFEKVTGPKTHFWLVKTAGLLIFVIGGTLISTGLHGAPSLEIFWLALASASVLAMVDLVYVAKKVISPIYLLDAALEIAIAGCWVSLLIRRAFPTS